MHNAPKKAVTPQYSLRTSRIHPGLVIFLCDFGPGSANESTAKNIRHCLFALMQSMANKSTKGDTIYDRYHIALYGYGDKVIDLLSGILPLSHALRQLSPNVQLLANVKLMQETRVDEAFLVAEQLLHDHLQYYTEYPAPLVCHLTAGSFPDELDPSSVIARIKQLHVQDGNVLIQNIICSQWPEVSPISNIRTWPGVTSTTQLTADYAKLLVEMSSPIPAPRYEALKEWGYHIDPQGVMTWPSAYPELVAGCFP